MKLDPEIFLEIVRLTPLVSIDLVVRNAVGEVLLGLRRNRPAQGMWFVPGGRLAKDERLIEALARQTRTELGLEVEPGACRFLGVFEHLYSDNFSAKPGIATHYIVLAYELSSKLIPETLPTEQHSDWRWFTVPELLESPSVHPNTKRYFE
jgi:colanic acid biosynthesis protein WcaH